MVADASMRHACDDCIATEPNSEGEAGRAGTEVQSGVVMIRQEHMKGFVETRRSQR